MESTKTILLTDLDHRNFTIPLFIVGAAAFLAGAIGLVVDATTDLAVLNPAGAMGFGLILLFASVAVTFILNPGAEIDTPAKRTIPMAAGAVVVLLLAAVGGGAAVGGSVEPAGPAGPLGNAAPGVAQAAGFLSTEDFSASLQGVMTSTPIGGIGGTGTTTQAHDLAIPATATSARFELDWEPASPGGATELQIRLETEDGTEIATMTGGPGIVLDVDDLAEAARIVVSLADGRASTAQEYHAYASYFDGAIPGAFTANE